MSDGYVKYVIANGLNNDGIEFLKERNIKVIGLDKNKNLDERINFHSDLLMFRKNKNIILCNEFRNSVLPDEFGKYNIIFENENLKNKYPYDVKLNAVNIGDKLICNIDTVSENVLKLYENENVINVKQGYTKCSVCMVNDSAFITDDESIFNACKDLFDVLLIKKGFVELNGFDYGFIGGASGKISKSEIVFTGIIPDEKCEHSVIEFCNKHSVECSYLSGKIIYDVGSIISLTEEF